MTGRWRPLPSSLEPEVAYLVRLLRQLKDRSGLGLAALAAKTTYSKSSWERYLNGTTLPPRHAIEALARLAGEPVDRLIALWEQAEARWSGRAGHAPPATVKTRTAVAADQVPGGSRTLSRSRGRLLVTVTGGALSASLAVLACSLGGVFAPGDSPTSSGFPASPSPVPVVVGCHGAQCAGQDANTMACDLDVASFADIQIGHTYVELRISDQCGSAWARISHSTVGDRVQVVDRNGRSEALTVPDPAATKRFLPTPMIAADRHSDVRACVQPVNGKPRCSPWGAARPVPVPPPTPLPRR